MSRIEEYLEYLKSHGRAERTLRDYQNKLSEMEQALRAGGFPTDPGETGTEALLYMRRALHGKEDTVRQYLELWDRFIVWRTGQRVLPRLGLLWNRKQIRRTFISPEEYGRMMGSAREPWERIVLVLGGMMGCRRIEMLRLRTEDIANGEILLRGKGHGDGLMETQPLTETTAAEIERYLAWRNRQPGASADDRFLLIPNKRGGFLGEKTMETLVPRIVTELAERAGARATTHTLRRLFGTTIYNATDHDLATTSRLLRHASVKVTLDCYIEPNPDRERSALELMCQALTF